MASPDYSQYQPLLNFLALKTQGGIENSLRDTGSDDFGGPNISVNPDWLANPTGIFDLSGGGSLNIPASYNPFFSTEVRDLAYKVATGLGLSKDDANAAALSVAQSELQRQGGQELYSEATSPYIIADRIAQQLYSKAGKPYTPLTPEQQATYSNKAQEYQQQVKAARSDQQDSEDLTSALQIMSVFGGPLAYASGLWGGVEGGAEAGATATAGQTAGASAPTLSAGELAAGAGTSAGGSTAGASTLGEQLAAQGAGTAAAGAGGGGIEALGLGAGATPAAAAPGATLAEQLAALSTPAAPGLGVPAGATVLAGAGAGALLNSSEATMTEGGGGGGLLEGLGLGAAGGSLLGGGGINLGNLLGAGLGFAGSYQQTEALKALAEKQMAMGAPYRDRLNALYANPMDYLKSPEVMGAVDQGTSALAKALSVQGNPFGSGHALQELQNYATTQQLNRLDAEKKNLANFGGLSSFNAAAPGTAVAGINAGTGMYNAAGYGLSQLFPQKNAGFSALMGLT